MAKKKVTKKSKPLVVAKAAKNKKVSKSKAAPKKSTAAKKPAVRKIENTLIPVQLGANSK